MHERLTTPPGMPAWRPATTPATPVEMPTFAMDRHAASPRAESTLYYTALAPVITADGAVIPSHTGAGIPDVIPAGRP